jgi:chromosome segregation ATPase
MHTKVHMPQTVAFFEQESTPSTGALRQSWKNRLYKELEMQNLYQRESVVRSVAQICHDLEDRCETVEEPLRLEQAKVKDLTIQADQLREQIESFRTKATDQQFRMEGLEADYENAEEENSALTLRLENLEEEKSELALGLKNLKAEFDVAVRQADDVLRAAREGFHTNKSQLESTLVRKEEELHLRSVRIAEMDSQISRLQDEVQAKEQEVKNHGESQAKLSLDLQESKQALEAERSTVVQQTEQIAKLQADGNELEHQLSCSKNEVTTLTDQCNEVSTRYRALEASSKQELEDLEARCEQELDLATTKASEEYETLHAQLQDALHNTEQVKSAHEDTQRRLESAQATVSSLEVKVQELSEAYSEKDEQLQELESWRRSIIDRAPKTPRQSRRRKSARHLEDDLSAQIPEGGQGITHTAMETVANASFSSGDSFSRTPKRQKPRPTFKIPAMHTPHGQKLGAAPKILSHSSAHAKRPALRAVSPNRRHTTVGVAFEQLEEKEGGEKKRSSLHLIQQGSFDMDTFLASTPMPFTPGNVVFGTGREPTEQQEETTEL